MHADSIVARRLAKQQRESVCSFVCGSPAGFRSSGTKTMLEVAKKLWNTSRFCFSERKKLYVFGVSKEV